MGTLKRCGLILALITLLTGCSRSLKVYTIVAVNDDTFTVTDGEFLYDYGEELTMTGRNLKGLLPIRELSSYGTTYHLTHLELNKYTGELKDAAAYCNYLNSCGFEQSTIEYRDNYLDMKLSNSSTEEVRVLYLGNSVVRIFYKSALSSNLFPPYINKEE